MALSKIQPASIDLTANYAFTGTNSVAGISIEEKKLATQTASTSDTLSFTSSIDSTYNIYKFRFTDIHTGSNNVHFTFQGSTDTGSSYGVTATTTFFKAYHNEGGSTAVLGYITDDDSAQSTNFIKIAQGMGDGNDECCVGELFLFDPSSTTSVKHFLCRINNYQTSDYSQDIYVSGYFNTTTAIDAIQFKMGSGNIDSGTIEMYGIN